MLLCSCHTARFRQKDTPKKLQPKETAHNVNVCPTGYNPGMAEYPAFFLFN